MSSLQAVSQQSRGRSPTRSALSGRKLQDSVAALKRKVRRQVDVPNHSLETMAAAVTFIPRVKRKGQGSESSSSTSSEERHQPIGRTQRVDRERKLAAQRRRKSKDFVSYMERDPAISFLEHRSVTAPVARNYLRSANQFLDYCRDNGLRLDVVHMVDGAMASFLNDLYMKGHGPSTAEHVVAGFVHRVPEYGNQGMARLPRTARCLKGFRSLVRPKTRRPHPRMTWAAVCVQLARRGCLQMAAWTLVGLSCYLRPMENMRLRRKDLVPPSSHVRGKWSIIVAASDTGLTTKTYEQDDAIILDSKALGWLGPVVKVVADGDPLLPLWDFTYSQLTTVYRAIALELDILDLVPYQLRHSGPSIDRASNERSIEDVKKRGRWISSQSVRRYEKAGRLSQTELTYSKAMLAFGAICDRQLEGVILGTISLPTDAGLTRAGRQ